MSFITIALLLGLSPGPDMLLVLHHAMRHGARAGLTALAGIASGAIVHLAVAAFGAGLLLERIPGGGAVLRLAGGTFLLWLAWKAVRSSGGVGLDVSGATKTPGGGAVYREGMLTNLLNPKVALFLLAFLPPFVPAASPHPALSIALLGMLFFLIGFVIMAALALVAGRLRLWLQRHPTVLRLQGAASAVLFAVFGLALLADL